MGVHGLTTFLKENRRSLSRTLELRSNLDSNRNTTGRDGHRESINLVVDGWSLIYAVYSNSGEPWVYGGEYGALGRHVETIVSSWISVGIRPVFVFDGPAPSLKYPTVISRLQNNCVKPANLFFRTSPAARSTPRSLAETRIAPPLGYQTIVSTLLCMGPDVKVEFADGEADPYIVALAARLGAYVTGSDSDFLVLNCEGYKGYIPLDEMTWTASAKDQNLQSPESSVLSEDYGSDFQTVTKKKQKQKSKAKESRVELGTAILPPTLPMDSDVTLVLAIYEPVVFAQHVTLPPPLLPLLGALIGNDYASFEFFRFTESSTQRVKRVADTLSSVLKEAQSGNAKKIRKVNRGGGQGSVMDVIGTTVERLLIWRDPANPPASGQVDKITEMVVRSTLEYALENSTSPLQNIQAPSPDVQVENAAEQVRRLYLQEYRRGTLHPKVIEVFMTGSCFPRLFLEDPDRECCARSIGQPIREVIWSILSDGGGIPERPEPLSGQDAENDPDLQTEGDEDFAEDDDELVDVVEEYSDDEISVADDDDDDDDPLAALRGKLQRLSFSGVEEVLDANDLELPEPESQESNSFVEVVKPPRPKMVTDYIRRGARVVGEESEVRDLHDILPEELRNTTPIQLRPVEERLRVFLHALGSDTPAILEIARSVDCSSKLLPVVTLRWILKTLHTRAEAVEEGSRKRDRNKEKWTRKEAQALLTCFYDEEEPVEQPQIEHRAVQLTAQVLAALEACGWLAQALLLVDLPGQRENGVLPILFGGTEKMFSGMKFHSALAHSRRASAESYGQMWSAVEDGLGNTFGEEKGRKGKKDRKSRDVLGVQSVTKTPVGMFGVLAGLDI